MTYTRRVKSLTTWNDEFASGHWTAVFDSSKEIPRYGVVAAYIHAYNPHAAILDLGCGQGTLHKYMSQYKSYLGVDFSEEAIKMAQSLTSNTDVFVQADIETYIPDQKFDLIIFNECLYYLEYPLDVLKRYEAFLNAGAAMIISLHTRPASEYIWEQINTIESYEKVYDVQLTTATDAWVVKLIKCHPESRV